MKSVLRICVLTILFFTSAVVAWAQGASNKGTDFWLMYGSHVAGFSTNQNNWQKMSVYLTSDGSTTGTIEIPGIGFSVPFNITANAVTEVQIPQTAYIGGVEGKFNKGINIKSLKPIVAYAHIYDSAVSGATLVLPTNTLGKEYYSLNFTQRSNSLNAYSFCSIVAVEDNTEVIIKPSVKTQGGLLPGVETTITLNRGEVYQLLGTETGRNASGATFSTGGDLTGTTIRSVAGAGQSCKKIAVFSGSTKIGIGCPLTGSPGSADNLFQQVYPTSTWGKSFVTVPSKNRNYDIYRVFKSTADAVVKLNGVVIPSTSFINNFYYEFSSQATNYIQSDKSIQIAQYQVTQGRSINCVSVSGDVGDPEMIFLNPLEQTLNKITMFSTPSYNILRHYINVVIRTSSVATFKIDGVSKASDFIASPNAAEYSYAQIEVMSGTHTLQAEGGFNATAYGFGANESYGYAAGASLISPGIEVNDETTNLPKEQGCIGEGYNLVVSLPYQPLSVVVNFDDGLGDRTATLTAPTTFVSNDITYYKYRLFSNIQFTVARKYLIKLAAEKPTADGCGAVDQLELEYEVLKSPIAKFDIVAAQVCNGSTTTFNDISSGEGNTIVKWHWDYGDGTKEIRTSAATFARTYPVGSYTVKLFVENQAGCLSEAFSKPISVYALPVANFTTSAVLCERKLVNFTSQSTSVDGNITGWAWDFGDGNTSTEQNPTHTYAAFGNYNVKLKVTTQFSCESIITKQITINPLPLVDFEIPDFCLADASAVFTNTTTIPSNEQLTYTWNFGDQNANSQRPNTSTERNGRHVYTSTGIYEVTLTVKSINNCEVIIKKQFTVNGSIPKAAFEVLNQNNLCTNTKVEFKDLATVDFGEVTKIEWFFDFDRKTSSDLVDNQPNLRNTASKIYSFKYPNFTDALSKTYKVKMKVYSGGSCVNEVVKMITVYPDAIPEFQLQVPCLPDGKASFTNSSSYIDPTASLTYLWDFGDNLATAQNPNTSTDKNPVHNYKKAGKYNVKLSITTPYGCETFIVKEITVEGAVPIADFIVKDASNLCVQQPIVFQDKATLDFGEITRIDWYYDFANNPTQVETDLSPGSRTVPKTYQHQYPIFSFPFSKNYVVKMVVFSGTTCINVIEKVITIYGMPDVEFVQPNPVCQEVPSINLSASEKKNMPGSGKFSGNGVDASGNFVPASAGVGEHTITYTYTPTNGCAVVKTRVIIVNETPVVDAGDDKVVLEGGQGTLTATAFGVDLTYKWTPSIGLDRDDVLNPIVIPTEDMVYTLKVTSANGCFALDEVKVKFLKNLVVPNAITPNGDGVNDVWNIKYIDSYPTVKVEIYDRGGQRVFYSQGYGVPFDGKFNNNDLPVGTYYYLINLNTRKKPLSGTLTIIR